MDVNNKNCLEHEEILKWWDDYRKQLREQGKNHKGPALWAQKRNERRK